MWEIESNSVGNGRPPVSLCPGQVGFVATPPGSVDKTGQVSSTKPRCRDGRSTFGAGGAGEILVSTHQRLRHGRTTRGQARIWARWTNGQLNH